MFLKEELEELLGFISNDDDYTQLLYKALITTSDKRDLLKYRNMCVDPNLKRRLEQVANRQKTPKNTGTKVNNRSSFEDLLHAGRAKSI